MAASPRATSRTFRRSPAGPYGYEHINAAIQRRHPDSLLNWTERIVRMRKEVPEVGWGDFTVIATRDPSVLVMRYDWRNNWVLFVHNFEAKPREVAFSVGLDGENSEYGKLLINLLAEEHSRAGDDESIGWSSKAMVIGGTASVGWTTSFAGRRLTSRL